jgi:hypothetical protein
MPADAMPADAMPADAISILDGSAFVVSDTHGDVEAGPDRVHGLFYGGTRFLLRWVTVDGRRPDVLSVENRKYSEAQFFLYPPTGTIYENRRSGAGVEPTQRRVTPPHRF